MVSGIQFRCMCEMFSLLTPCAGSCLFLAELVHNIKEVNCISSFFLFDSSQPHPPFFLTSRFFQAAVYWLHSHLFYAAPQHKSMGEKLCRHRCTYYHQSGKTRRGDNTCRGDKT